MEMRLLTASMALALATVEPTDPDPRPPVHIVAPPDPCPGTDEAVLVRPEEHFAPQEVSVPLPAAHVALVNRRSRRADAAGARRRRRLITPSKAHATNK